MPNPVLEKAQQRGSEEMTGMSFLEHLEELRRRIIYSFLYIVGGFCVCWWFHEQIFALMQKPIMVALAAHQMEQKLVYLNPTDPFNMYLKISFIAGVFVASPFVLYQIWLFISPGLYRNERRYVMPFMFSTVGLFLAAGWMWRNLRYSILVIFIIAAVITPTTDIMNMCIFAAPMIVLYLVSIAIAWFVHPAQRRKRAGKADLE